MIAETREQKATNQEVEIERAVGGKDGEGHDGIVWWKPMGRSPQEEGDEPEVHAKHPERWWTEDEKDDKGDIEIQNRKTFETARERTQEPKSRELRTAASPENFKKEMKPHNPRPQSEKNDDKRDQDIENDKFVKDDKIKKGLSQDGLRLDPQHESDETGREPKKNTKVHSPSREEVEDHERTHCPFKAWCTHCVRGRGRNLPHKRAKPEAEEDHEDGKVSRVAMDYFFMSKKDEEAKENPILAMVDEKTGERYARACGSKGVGSHGELDWLIQDMTDELKSWGHTGGVNGHIILKSDNENAVKALRDAVGRLLGGRVIPENLLKGESQANGKVEETCKTTRGFMKVLKSQLEENTGVKIEGKDSITQCMIRWSAMLPSRFMVGKDKKKPKQGSNKPRTL